ncbi:hypothetical protein PSPO01_14463 [Paraphaeosphaeria sporulosa]
MAAPLEKTLQPLSGNRTLNKASSDDFTTIPALQGGNLLIRQGPSAATSIHKTITQAEAQHIEASQSVTAGKIPGTTEEYILD